MDSSPVFSRAPAASLWPLIRMVGLFALIFFVLQLGYQSARGTVVERIVIDVITIKPSVQIINWLAPGEQVRSSGSQLTSSTTRISVLNGCEGTEALFLIIAAILARRSGLTHTLVGLVLGTILIYSLNQLRIVGLYFALRQEPALFSALHGYIYPTSIIALGSLYVMGWMQWSERKSIESS